MFIQEGGGLVDYVFDPSPMALLYAIPSYHFLFPKHVLEPGPEKKSGCEKELQRKSDVIRRI